METVFKNMRWLGHDGFLIRAEEKVIYIDPYKVPDDLPAADVILVTHEHYDHCSPEDIAKLQNDDTIIVTERDSARKLQGVVTVVQPGMTTEIGGMIIETVPAYNLNKKFHPKKNGWLGFILTVDGVRIYHAGDTDHIPEMADVTTDIALLPVSGTYVMTAQEAVQAALEIQPRIAIPMHCGSLVGTMDDAQEFAEGLAGKIRVEILA